MCSNCNSNGLSESPNRRRKLWELDARIHCSIIGTCLTMNDLHRIERRLNIEPLRTATDFQVHGNFVLWAQRAGPAARHMQKILERRYAAAVRRFAGATSLPQLAGMWMESLDAGDVPGPYWAVLTHPLADEPLRLLAFGQVHMLSHLVGAANRADVRRLLALERERNALTEALTAAKRRINDLDREAALSARQHALTVGDLARRLSAAEALAHELQAARRRCEQLESGEALRALRDHAGAQRRALDRARQDADAARSACEALARENAAQSQELQRLEQALRAREAECEATEAALCRHLEAGCGRDAAASGVAIDLAGRRIVYVGGRGGIVPHLRAYVEKSGGTFLHHDGGLEENSVRLESLLGGSDAVFCPVDCISHDACLRAKSVCKRRAATFVPLRTCSLSAFVAAVRLLPGAADSVGAEITGG